MELGGGCLKPGDSNEGLVGSSRDGVGRRDSGTA